MRNNMGFRRWPGQDRDTRAGAGADDPWAGHPTVGHRRAGHPRAGGRHAAPLIPGGSHARRHAKLEQVASCVMFIRRAPPEYGGNSRTMTLP